MREGHQDDETLWTKWKANQLTRYNLFLKVVIVSFKMHPQKLKMTRKWLRMNLFKEPLLIDPNSTPSVSSSGTKTELIVEIKPNPESGDVQLPNAPRNTKNDQKMNENLWSSSILGYVNTWPQTLPISYFKKSLTCFGLALCGHSHVLGNCGGLNTREWGVDVATSNYCVSHSDQGWILCHTPLEL